MRWVLVAILATGLLAMGAVSTNFGREGSTPGLQLSNLSEEEDVPVQIADSISPGCLKPGESRTNGLPNLDGMSVRILDSRGWSTNLRGAFLESREPPNTIADEFKDTFLGRIDVTWIDGVTCSFEAEIRISGDLSDHVRLESGSVLSSLDVKLVTGNVGGVVRFKLFLPQTRNSESEVFATEMLRHLGYLAPRTALIPVSVNGNQYTAMFQEKVAKEMVEANNLRESALVEVDEEFYFKRPTNGDTRGVFARMSNTRWALKSNTSLDVAEAAMNRLSSAIAVARGRSPAFPIEYMLQPDDDFESRRDVAAFRSALVALAGGHALYVTNRKFYFDPHKDRLIPIYYDGDIGSPQDLGPIEPFIDARSWNEGVRTNLEHARELNVVELQRRLNELGADSLSVMDVRQRVHDFIDSLEGQVRSPSEFASVGNRNAAGVMPKAQAGIFDNYSREFRAVTKNDSAEWVYCDTPGSSCEKFSLEKDSLRDLLEGRFEEEGISYKYMGSEGREPDKERKSEAQRIELDEGVGLEVFGAVSLEVNSREKTLRLTQTDSSGRVVVTGGSLSDWTIEFLGSGGGNRSSDLDSRFDSRLLTGCLTLQDLSLSAVELIVLNTSCEDGVNLVRVNGDFNRVFVDTSMQDAIDADFSQLDFGEVIVSGAGNDCIDLSSGHYRIQVLETDSCGDKALSVGEASVVRTVDFKARQSAVGVASKDSSTVKIDAGAFTDVDLCGAVYRKKQEFSGASLSIADLDCTGASVWVQEGSQFMAPK